jgi:hypothetical protein
MGYGLGAVEDGSEDLQASNGRDVRAIKSRWVIPGGMERYCMKKSLNLFALPLVTPGEVIISERQMDKAPDLIVPGTVTQSVVIDKVSKLENSM